MNIEYLQNFLNEHLYKELTADNDIYNAVFFMENLYLFDNGYMRCFDTNYYNNMHYYNTVNRYSINQYYDYQEKNRLCNYDSNFKELYLNKINSYYNCLNQKIIELNRVFYLSNILQQGESVAWRPLLQLYYKRNMADNYNITKGYAISNIIDILLLKNNGFINYAIRNYNQDNKHLTYKRGIIAKGINNIENALFLRDYFDYTGKTFYMSLIKKNYIENEKMIAKKYSSILQGYSVLRRIYYDNIEKNRCIKNNIYKDWFFTNILNKPVFFDLFNNSLTVSKSYANNTRNNYFRNKDIINSPEKIKRIYSYAKAMELNSKLNIGIIRAIKELEVKEENMERTINEIIQKEELRESVVENSYSLNRNNTENIIQALYNMLMAEI